MQERFVVYTAMFGDRDHLTDPVNPSNKCDYICFTDQTSFKSNVWDIEKKPLAENPRLEAKRYKLLPHNFFPHSIALWVDGSMTITSKDISKIIEKYRRIADFIALRGTSRHCLNEEVSYCLSRNLASETSLFEQIKRYRDMGMKDNIPQLQAGLLLRKIHSEKIDSFNEEWWQENVKYTLRDEISLPFLLWKHEWKQGDDYGIFDFDINQNPHIFYRKH